MAAERAMSEREPRYVHATCVVVAEAGVLIRGASGAGKSRQAQALIAHAAGLGLFARLVGDDRVGISRHHGRLVARPHPRGAGLIEERGTGVLQVAHESAAVIRLVVDRAARAPRHPAAPDAVVDEYGVELPRLALDASVSFEEGARRVLARLNAVARPRAFRLPSQAQ